MIKIYCSVIFYSCSMNTRSNLLSNSRVQFLYSWTCNLLSLSIRCDTHQCLPKRQVLLFWCPISLLSCFLIYTINTREAWLQHNQSFRRWFLHLSFERAQYCHIGRFQLLRKMNINLFRILCPNGKQIKNLNIVDITKSL